MGVLDELTRLFTSKTPGKVEGQTPYGYVHGTAFMSDQDGVERYSIEKMWESQPNLRTVVDFFARNISQLNLHLFERDGEETNRVRTGPVADVLGKPNESDTLTELLYALVGDWALYEDVYVVALPNLDGGKTVRVIPAAWVTPKYKNSFEVERYDVSQTDGGLLKLLPDQVCRFKGWTPANTKAGTSRVETLRLILEEQHHARVYRKQIWKKAGRFGGILTRPKDAPSWDNAARRRFDKMWMAFTGDGGSRAGDTPLLEDGMDYKRAGFAAKEDQFVESAKLSLETVAQVYHVNPTMIGMLDNANFANVREFRRGLYGDTLGPVLRMIEDRFNTFLLPMLGAPPNQYVEFNVEAKLRGSFEEQSNVVSTATGAPWQTRNEARKLFNLKPVDGGDELIVPLNVLVGGQASPQDGGPGAGQNSFEHVLRKFLERQGTVVAAKRASGLENWWDIERWDRELTADLKAAGMNDQFAVFIARKVNEEAERMHGEGADTGALVQKALEGI
ncbi:HK97 family phage portal protein [Arthrobacter sp. 9V]|uniref:phage portal protein n=1 Tax=Arthrobacter sp. 9V TaxID=2653132 RepID=UPI0012F1A729|nr:phage portal protein [Arthrobacter sp. 9V]VXB25241.1 HK97 family phage portal protein [Arthrobacter sp. 9V]